MCVAKEKKTINFYIIQGDTRDTVCNELQIDTNISFCYLA